MKPLTNQTATNKYEEYLWIEAETRFELFGTINTNVDLSDYYTKEEINTSLFTKVDKIEGKGLTDNNFTNYLILW